ncbi:MAG: glycoside hydrolase family 20 zincin-like fold domain-containing protein [Armatimonadota bacterium]|nr:glycoside hydrolase family 20 zincin-like fold domain-containing protein [Armatimonadota bacterium]
MRELLIAACIIIPVGCHAAPQGWTVTRVSGEQRTRWLRQLLPLPQQIAIPRAVTLPADEVRLVLADDAGETEGQAAAELRELFQAQVGVDLDEGGFTLLLGVCDEQGRLGGRTVPSAQRLREVPNAEQAYVIQPLDEDTLALGALDPRGVYYAARTLCQLLEGRFADGGVTIPLAEVVDWPDIEERGEWGGSAGSDIEWMAEHKLNLVERHAGLSFTDDGAPVAELDEDRLRAARLRALNLVPIIHHLDYLGRTGIFEHYPEVEGEGEERADVGGSPAPLCFHEPQTKQIIGGWMRELAAMEGVTDIQVWLSEWHGHCTCEQCQQAAEQGLPQHALEAKVVGEILQEMRDEGIDIDARVLLTQGSFPVNEEVLAAAPPELDISYYCGAGRPLSTYNSSREPMIYPLMQRYAAEGNWLGVYPQFTASFALVCPWSGPQFMKYRMTEFAEKGIDSVCGYTVPNNQLHEFNVLAAAEWGWNVDGRSPREFAIAWATRKGVEDAEAVGEWAELLGPITWNLYGSPHGCGNHLALLRQAAALIQNGTAPELGEGIWRYYDSVEQLDEDLHDVAEARRIAERLDVPELVHDTRFAQSNAILARRIYEVAELVAAGEVFDRDVRQRLQEAMTDVANAGLQGRRALVAWRDVISPDVTGGRYDGTLRAVQGVVDAVAQGLQPYGIVDPSEPWRRHRIAGWDDKTMERGRQTLQWEVTEALSGPGDYEVIFGYERGQQGLPTRRVALASAPADAPDELTEISADEHEGFAGHMDRDHIYRVSLDELDPDLGYFVVAEIVMPSSTEGSVYLKAAGDPPAFYRVPELPPLTEEQERILQSRTEGPVFEGTGLAVAVMQGGYGSTSIMEALQGCEGLDVAPLWEISREALAPCEVVVVPQPRSGGMIGEREARLLRKFVGEGGGLIATHDAVGYRGLPAPLPAICTGGADHIRERTWKVIAEHPVTAEISPGAELTHSYYDHVLLDAGDAGIVVATDTDGRPVAVCGEHGQGRYLATGLAIGLAPDDSDAAPTDHELRLLLNAIRWCAGS